MSRAETLRRKKIPEQMPPNPLPSTMRWLIELGVTQSGGIGAVPLTWQEMEAWQRQTGVVLPPWELRLIRHLSGEYLAESRRAEDANCPPPWIGRVTEREQEVEREELRGALG